MASTVTITLNDGQATPVAHDFVPGYRNGNTLTCINRDADTSAGNYKLVLGFSPASANRPTDRIGLRLNMPREHVVDSVTEVADIARFSCDIVIPDGFEDTDRADLYAFLKNLFAHASIQDYIENLDPMI